MTVTTPLTAAQPPGESSPAPPAEPLAWPIHTDSPATRLLREGARDGRVTHIERIPGRAGQVTSWPQWVPPELREAFTSAGIAAPWVHQATAAEHARAGRNVIVSTPAASGKSLAYLMPA